MADVADAMADALMGAPEPEKQETPAPEAPEAPQNAAPSPAKREGKTEEEEETEEKRRRQRRDRFASERGENGTNGESAADDNDPKDDKPAMPREPTNESRESRKRERGDKPKGPPPEVKGSTLEGTIRRCNECGKTFAAGDVKSFMKHVCGREQAPDLLPDLLILTQTPRFTPTFGPRAFSNHHPAPRE